MVILGINPSHTATACLLIDGGIIACVSEERLSRVKNQVGLPVAAVREVLRIGGVSDDEVDRLVISFEDSKVSGGFSPLPAGALKNGKWWSGDLWTDIKKVGWRLKEEALVRVPESREMYDKWLPRFYQVFVDGKIERWVRREIEEKMGIASDKVVKVDHHTAHIYSAYFSSPFWQNEPVLVLTLDAMGDGVCATVSVGRGGKLRRVATTPAGNSVGDLYAFVTSYLGMKMGEHEYKVMGMAPYAGEEQEERVHEKLKSLIWLKKDLTFGTDYHSHIFYKVIPQLLKGERFDSISAGMQRLTEELLTSWVRAAVKKTGVRRVACGGGVFMNVKANQKIWELPEVKGLFVMPSCGDESTAIGAAYWGYEKSRGRKRWSKIEPLSSLYFGREFGDGEIKKELNKKKYGKYRVTRPRKLARAVAKLLAEGEIVARFAGRMEWGARALGNRSILAHPAKLEVIREINSQIKSRDFWMPFAPAIMEGREDKYMVNPKKVEASYMIVTFDSTEEGRDKFRAAMHQYDFSLRPQIVKREWNEGYWKVMFEFEKLTGIGGVLNTSFNLHGYPIVCTPREALDVFSRSGLQHLALGSYLVSKK